MKTPLYDQHVALGAKIVEFAGWQMPIYYSSIVQEHHAVRNAMGIFDVSHMGRVLIEGLEAETFVDFLSTNAVKGLSNGKAVYTALCHEHGGCVDDAIIYKEDPEHFFLIVNAGNRQKDFSHIVHHSATFDIMTSERYDEEGILAVQGPKALELVSQFFPEVRTLGHMAFIKGNYEGKEVIIASTGYTGAGGVELYVPKTVLVSLWNALLEAGKPNGLVPIGLGARDTLRLEMGYALYGHELTDDIQPIESVSAWTVKSAKHDFLGKSYQQKKQRSQYGAILIDKGIAREGYQVYKDGVCIGCVTSGTFSPTLQKAIAIVMSDVPLTINDEIDIQIRQQTSKAKIVKLPFLS